MATNTMGAALSLLVLALSSAGFAAANECKSNGRFWDGCNWCWCLNHEVMGCTNMACTGMPYEAWHLDPNNDPTIGPPERPGMLNYRSGHGRVADPSGWPCQIGSSWLEQGGCVKCNCNRKAIRCRDSGLCLNGELVSNDLARAQMVRRRRDADSNPAAGAAPAPATAAAPAGEPTATAVETTTAPVAVPTVAPVVEPAVTPDTTTAIPAETTAAPAGAGAAETTDVPAAAVGGTTASPAALDASNTTQAPPSVALPPQNTVVKERSCKSGSTWEEDCNSCWCLDNGRAACTTNSCDQPQPPALPLSVGGVGGAAAALPTSTPAPTPAPTPASAPSLAPVDGAAATPTVPAPATSTAAPAPKPEAAAPVAAPATGSRRKRRVVLVAT